jgi:hypothetical protein
MQAYDLFFACLRIMEREAWLIKESRVLTFPFGRLRMAPLAGPELTESTERGMCRVSRNPVKPPAFHSVFMDSLNY